MEKGAAFTAKPRLAFYRTNFEYCTTNCTAVAETKIQCFAISGGELPSSKRSTTKKKQSHPQPDQARMSQTSPLERLHVAPQVAVGPDEFSRKVSHWTIGRAVQVAAHYNGRSQTLRDEAIAHDFYSGGRGGASGGGASSFVACHSHLTIDLPSLFRSGAPFLLLILIETPPTFGRSLRLSYVLNRKFLPI